MGVFLLGESLLIETGQPVAVLYGAENQVNLNVTGPNGECFD